MDQLQELTGKNVGSSKTSGARGKQATKRPVSRRKQIESDDSEDDLFADEDEEDEDNEVDDEGEGEEDDDDDLFDRYRSLTHCGVLAC